MSNRIKRTFGERSSILNIYFTAGFPKLRDTLRIAKALENGGVDMLEIGIPFSDPVADGPTIQESSKKALDNGMTLELLFEQLGNLREHVTIPVLLMGYVNPILQYGMEKFCEKCKEVGIDGTIIPDLPIQEYQDSYETIFKSTGLENIFLISPNTSMERIEVIDSISNGFIYMVSSASTTGAKDGLQEGQLEYYRRIEKMQLKRPRLIGFGISNKETFDKACEHANGAIIGSAFINQLEKDSSEDGIEKFVHSIKER